MSAVIPVRISFQVYDPDVFCRGAIVTTRGVKETLDTLRQNYSLVVPYGFRVEVGRPEEVKIYDILTNDRLMEHESRILDACQGL
jgi:hypothetical protein